MRPDLEKIVRKAPKGRDLFDLLWYLSDPDWPQPNLDLLNNALTQSQWQRGRLTTSSWRKAVLDRLERLDWQRAVDDLRPFVRCPADLDRITLENAASLLRRKSPHPFA